MAANLRTTYLLLETALSSYGEEVRSGYADCRPAHRHGVGVMAPPCVSFSKCRECCLRAGSRHYPSGRANPSSVQLFPLPEVFEETPSQ